MSPALDLCVCEDDKMYIAAEGVLLNEVYFVM